PYAVSRARTALHSFPTRRSSDLCPSWQGYPATSPRLGPGPTPCLVLRKFRRLKVLVSRNCGPWGCRTRRPVGPLLPGRLALSWLDRKSTRLNSRHVSTSYAVVCL